MHLWSQNLCIQVPQQRSRYPHLEHPRSHGRIYLKEIIQAVCSLHDQPFWTIKYWRFFQKNALNMDIFGRIFTKSALNSRMQSTKHSCTGPQQEALTSVLGGQTFPSPWPACVSYTQRTFESENFQLKTLQNRLNGCNQRSSILFRRKCCTSVQVKKDVFCPTCWLEQCSVSQLGLDVEMQTPDFHAARREGASQGIKLSRLFTRLHNPQGLLSSPSSS